MTSYGWDDPAVESFDEIIMVSNNIYPRFCSVNLEEESLTPFGQMIMESFKTLETSTPGRKVQVKATFRV